MQQVGHPHGERETLEQPPALNQAAGGREVGSLTTHVHAINYWAGEDEKRERGSWQHCMLPLLLCIQLLKPK